MLVIFTFKREIAFLMGNLSYLLLQLLNEWAFQPFQIFFFFFRVNNLPQGFLNPLGDRSQSSLIYLDYLLISQYCPFLNAKQTKQKSR